LFQSSKFVYSLIKHPFRKRDETSARRKRKIKIKAARGEIKKGKEVSLANIWLRSRQEICGGKDLFLQDSSEFDVAKAENRNFLINNL
jgi:hypothetical protein